MQNPLLPLAFLLLPLQQPTPTPDIDIALILSDRIVLMKKSEAERLLPITPSPQLRAALEIALGTAIELTPTKAELTQQETERFRWHRRPLQSRPP